MMVLDKKKLFGNLKKCTFFTLEVTFLGISSWTLGIIVDESTIEVIQTWPIPKSIHYVWSFHGLTSFYRWFVKNFSTIMAPMTKMIKGTSFRWNPKA